MATLKSIIVLDDRVTPTLTKIAAQGMVVDGVLDKLDNSLRKIEVTASILKMTWVANMAEMAASSKAMRESVQLDLNELKREVRNLTVRKHTINIDADTGAAVAQIRLLKAEMASAKIRSALTNGTSTGSWGSVGMGSWGGGSGGGRSAPSAPTMPAAIRRAAPSGGSIFDGGNPISAAMKAGGGGRGGVPTPRVRGVNANLGPISLSASALTKLLPTVGVPAISVVAGAVGTLSTAVTSLGAALVATGALASAFGVGVAAIGIPMSRTISNMGQWMDVQKQAKDALDSTKAGTKAHTKALAEYNRVMSNTPPLTQQLIDKWHKLQDAWNGQMQKGGTGAVGFEMVNQSLDAMMQSLPFVVSQMERFAKAAGGAFSVIKADGPVLKSVVQDTFAAWPKYFQQGTLALYSFTKGLMGLFRGATPFVDFLSQGLLDISNRFDKWTNSVSGQQKMNAFFSGMVPIFSELVVLFWDIGKAMVQMAMDPSMQKNTILFIKFLEDMVAAMPKFLIVMTDAAAKLGPLWRAFGNDFMSFTMAIAPAADSFYGSLAKIHQATTPFLPGWATALVDGLVLIGGVKLANRGGGKIFSLLKGLSILGAGAGARALSIDKLAASLRGLGGAAATVGGESVAGAGATEAGGGMLSTIGSIGGGAMAGLGAIVAVAGAAVYASWNDNTNKIQERWALALSQMSSGYETFKQGFSEQSAALGIDWEGVNAQIEQTMHRTLASFDAMWEGIKSGAKGTWDFIKNTFLNTGSIISQSISGWVSGAGAAMAIMGNTMSALADGINWVKGALGMQGTLGDGFTAGSSAIIDAFGGAAPTAPAGATGDAPAAMNALKGAASGAGSFANNLIDSGGGGLLSRIGGMMPGVPGMGNTIGAQFTRGSLQRLIAMAKDRLSSMASGGSVAGGALKAAGKGALAGLGGLNPAFGSIVSMAQKLGVGVTSTTGGKHAKGSWHYSGNAVDFSNGGSPTPQMDALYSSLVPYAQSGAIGQLIYRNNGWQDGQQYNYKSNDHMNHVHVGVRGGATGDAPQSVLGAARGATNRSNAAGGRASGVKISISGVTVNSGHDIDQLAHELASRVEHHMGNLPMEDAMELGH